MGSELFTRASRRDLPRHARNQPRSGSGAASGRVVLVFVLIASSCRGADTDAAGARGGDDGDSVCVAGVRVEGRFWDAYDARGDYRVNRSAKPLAVRQEPCNDGPGPGGRAVTRHLLPVVGFPRRVVMADADMDGVVYVPDTGAEMPPRVFELVWDQPSVRGRGSGR